MPGHVGVSEQLACRISRCARFGHTVVQILLGNLLHVQVSYCKYSGMKLENWDAATCRSLAQV